MEYEVGGIKTTLPFFREVMEDADFIEGRIDTGFIERFMERRKRYEIPVVVQDMAIIAAALAYSNRNAVVKHDSETNSNKPTRWAAFGRSAPFSK